MPLTKEPKQLFRKSLHSRHHQHNIRRTAVNQHGNTNVASTRQICTDIRKPANQMASLPQSSPRSPPDPLRVETLSYGTGGFHPVHLGDTFKMERYTVIHKLGHGGFATVWLARDCFQSRYVALKILAARLSKNCPEVKILRRLSKGEDKRHIGKEFVMSLLDHFWIDGPNGNHLCVVSEVGGPSLKVWNDNPRLKSSMRRLNAAVARKILLQAVEGLAYIHSTGTVHGDFTSTNILLKLANIDAWTVEEIHQRFGKPQLQELRSGAGPSATPSISNAPRYTVNAINLKAVDPKWLSDQIMIIDFGIAFLQDQSSEHIGTPKSYQAPEFLFNCPRSINSDVWALGCTIFEVRTGSSLFHYKGTAPSRDQMLGEMVQVLGSLPPSWLDKWEVGRKQHIVEVQKLEKFEGIDLGNLHTLIMGVAKLDTIKNSLDSVKWTSLSSNRPKDPASAVSTLHSSPGSTGRLIALVGGLATDDAAEILYSAFRTASKSGPSRALNEASSHSSSSNSKSDEKSKSLEGISTLGGSQDSYQGSEQAESKAREPVDFPVDLTESLGVEYSESVGIMISEREAKGLEDLLRRALRFVPDERIALWELAEHNWFSDDFGANVKAKLGDTDFGTQECAVDQIEPQDGGTRK